MKKLLFVLLFLVPYFGFSQGFERSKNYIFNDIEHLKTAEYFSVHDALRDPLIINIKEKKTGEIRETIEVHSAESFCSVWVDEMEIKGFKNVKSIVRVSYDYCGCCSDVTETTYLVKTNGDWVPFPKLNYFTCDYPQEKPAYQFEGDRHPIIQEIQFVTEYRNEEGDLYKSKQIGTFTWNGKFIVKKED